MFTWNGMNEKIHTSNSVNEGAHTCTCYTPLWLTGLKAPTN